MSLRLALVTTAVALGLSTGCSLFRTEYPPAYPAPRIPWDPSKPYVFTKATAPKDVCPPPIQRVANRHGIPSAAEWQGQWKLKAVTQRVCRVAKKKRVCRQEPKTAVDTANRQAVIRATPWNTKQGSNGGVRFPFDPRQEHIFEIVTSPSEFTYLVLLEGERQATQMLLNPEHWEVLYGKSGEEGSRQEVLTVRPIVQPDQKLPPPTRAMLVYQSGVKKRLLFKAQERPGMISVEWALAEESKKPVPPPMDEQPPAFDSTRVYAAYTITLEGKKKFPPPWLPEAVVDDGMNTLIKFRTQFEGVRLPVLNGVQQNGQPALVQTRLYVRPDAGAWLWVQGLWPALTLKDAAGITVKVVRQVPKPGEVSYEDLKVSQVDHPAQSGGPRDGRHGRPGVGTNRHPERLPSPPGPADEADGPGLDGDGQWDRDGWHDQYDVFTVSVDVGT